MPDKDGNLYLYEALELRSEYRSRIETLKNILPENFKWGTGMYGNNKSDYEPVDEFGVKKFEDKIKTLEKKQRLLNNAIQACNFNNYIKVNGEEMSIAEALNLRKATNEKIGELASKLIKSAYKRIEHKEDRDIEKKPSNSFTEVYEELSDKRKLFRELNRKIRKVGYELTVDFKDE